MVLSQSQVKTPRPKTQQVMLLCRNLFLSVAGRGTTYQFASRELRDQGGVEGDVQTWHYREDIETSLKK